MPSLSTMTVARSVMPGPSRYRPSELARPPLGWKSASRGKETPPRLLPQLAWQ